MAAQSFCHQHRVSYAECTAGNHVYYAHYLSMLEEARGEFFRHLGVPFLRWQQEDTIFPVIECRVRYKSPARYDDLLRIEVWLTEIARVSMDFAYRIVNQADDEVLQASTSHACLSVSEKVKRLPAELVRLLQPYLRSA